MRAQKKDIKQLISMLLAFLEDEQGSIGDEMKASLQLQLNDYNR